MASGDTLTLGDVARRFGCDLWQVRSLYTRGILPEPARVGIYRTVKEDDVPAIEAALRKAGYIPEKEDDKAFALAGK
jgi:hypothetical protein